MGESGIGHSGPQILLSAGCLFHLPLKTIARIGSDAGFAGMELIMNSPKLVPGQEMKDLSAILPIKSIHAPFRDWDKWGGHLHSWKATTRLANSLDEVAHITLHPPGTRLANMIQNRWFNRAHDLPLLLDARGRLDFSLENMPWPQESPFARDPLDRLMDECQKKNVGLTFDVCHMGVSDRDVLQAIDKVPVDLLYNVHFSDAKGYKEHLTPGSGNLPLDEFLRRLARLGYRRFITLELEPAAFPDNIQGTVDLLVKLRENMERVLRGQETGA